MVEFAGIGPAPMAAMLLADLGAEVIRIDRFGPSNLGIKKPKQFDILARGRQSVAIDLKHPDGIACVLDILPAPRSARECGTDAAELLSTWSIDRGRTAFLRDVGFLNS
jgi:hypothetical protein